MTQTVTQARASGRPDAVERIAAAAEAQPALQAVLSLRDSHPQALRDALRRCSEQARPEVLRF